MMELTGIESIRFLAAKTDTVDNPIQQLLAYGMNPAKLVTWMSTGMFTATAAIPTHKKEEEEEEDSCGELRREALRAARMAHAPYSGNHAGIALLLSDGRLAIGPVIESVAFNPTISPLEVALVVVTHKGRHSKKSFPTMVDMITAAYLIEIQVDTGAAKRDGWQRQTAALLSRVCSNQEVPLTIERL